MSKTAYISPSIDVVEIETRCMLCMSVTGDDLTGDILDDEVIDGWADSHEFGDWDDFGDDFSGE